MQVLFITANPKRTETSMSLSLGEKFLTEYQKAMPKDEVIKIDIYDTDIPEIDYDLMEAIGSLKMGLPLGDLSEKTQARLKRYNELTDQFVKADKYIFVTPMWNLGIPSRFKSYIDTICVAGKTFKYTPKGPQGLLENKKCLHLHASGGFHSQDPMNHADPYVRDIMNFIGVDQYKCLFIEGHSALPDQADSIINKVYDQIPETVKWFANN